MHFKYCLFTQFKRPLVHMQFAPNIEISDHSARFQKFSGFVV
jgi:hypothetical protein